VSDRNQRIDAVSSNEEKPMSWIVEDNAQHEGYAAHVARDGRCATATRADGMVMASSRVGQILTVTGQDN
jgi:hypothetical protein